MPETAPSDVVRRVMLALGKGDLDGFAAELSQDIEWHGTGNLLPVGVWRGKAVVLDALQQNAARRGRPTRIVLREVSSRGQTVLLLGVVELEDPHGARTSVVNNWVFTLRAGLVQRVTAYLSDGVARAAHAKAAEA
jgi:ketosteroid isomerase-like protein